MTREVTILPSVWLEFGKGMENAIQQTFLRARIGSAACGAEIGYGAAALLNYGEESSHVQREREKGKKGTACSSPSREATAMCRCRGSAAQRRNHGVAEAGRRSSSTGNLMRSGAWVGEEELGEDPGPEAERRRWLAMAEVLRSSRTTAAQR